MPDEVFTQRQTLLGRCAEPIHFNGRCRARQQHDCIHQRDRLPQRAKGPNNAVAANQCDFDPLSSFELYNERDDRRVRKVRLVTASPTRASVSSSGSSTILRSERSASKSVALSKFRNRFGGRSADSIVSLPGVLAIGQCMTHDKSNRRSTSRVSLELLHMHGRGQTTTASAVACSLGGAFL